MSEADLWIAGWTLVGVELSLSLLALRLAPRACLPLGLLAVFHCFVTLAFRNAYAWFPPAAPSELMGYRDFREHVIVCVGVCGSVFGWIWIVLRLVRGGERVGTDARG